MAPAMAVRIIAAAIPLPLLLSEELVELGELQQSSRGLQHVRQQGDIVNDAGTMPNLSHPTMHANQHACRLQPRFDHASAKSQRSSECVDFSPALQHPSRTSLRWCRHSR